jgi:hypothetical protein
MLWLETLSATGHGDVRELSRRMVAYYSNRERKVPKAILLACQGWEVINRRNEAA